ncbi:MAG: hypothetical protein AB1813_09525 [Verrucomicrobiota bacterium]
MRVSPSSVCLKVASGISMKVKVEQADRDQQPVDNHDPQQECEWEIHQANRLKKNLNHSCLGLLFAEKTKALPGQSQFQKPDPFLSRWSRGRFQFRSGFGDGLIAEVGHALNRFSGFAQSLSQLAEFSSDIFQTTSGLSSHARFGGRGRLRQPGRATRFFSFQFPDLFLEQMLQVDRRSQQLVEFFEFSLAFFPK